MTRSRRPENQPPPEYVPTTIRLTMRDWTRLTNLADDEGMSVAALVRGMVARCLRECQEKGAEQNP